MKSSEKSPTQYKFCMLKMIEAPIAEDNESDDQNMTPKRWGGTSARVVTLRVAALPFFSPCIPSKTNMCCFWMLLVHFPQIKIKALKLPTRVGPTKTVWLRRLTLNRILHQAHGTNNSKCNSITGTLPDLPDHDLRD